MEPNKKYLIVNADDFGLLEGVNNGIIKAYQDGIVTSASIMPTGKSFDHAVQLAKKNSGLEIGVHLSLTQEKPVLEAKTILTLVDSSGTFDESWQKFVLRYLFGKINISEIEFEFDAQIKKVFKSGLLPTHLDSHQYVHIIPSIWKVMNKLMKKHSIKFIRYPKEMNLVGCVSFKNLIKVIGIKYFLSLVHKNKHLQNNCLDYFFGLGSSGGINESVLKKYLQNLRCGVTELICHPGDLSRSKSYGHWDYHWHEELDALTNPDIIELVNELNVKLINRTDTYE